ncbi:hypothetical protein Acy02nite_22240 [Actinoplanes cyaneus]|uniref:Uncharacterized protein n=1 Tax=Actinoplanes cyaneus TaxID=52696 RepID=A0A919M4M1_9ACTN|nr:hypothetical protein [Actinoplanes cyaneus]MCW2136511.1 hypothetical protein [Actinoplanes cyaneus]GID64343.1 hypothetical protein Acy02nite_22240 [Actinoplanes cyaneus]
MTFVHVDIHQITHTCPADPQPHPVDTRRTIVATVDGGPCRNPITIRCGDKTATIDCGRHEPHDRQCPACRTIVIERQITSTFVGHEGTQHPTTGIAA